MLLLIAALGLLTAGHVLAQPPNPSPDKVRTLTDLLRDPSIQAWLKTQAESMPVGAEQKVATASEPVSAQQIIAARLDAMRSFLRELAAAVPILPDELGRAWGNFSTELRERGAHGLVALLAAFAALGFGLEWLFWWATTGFRRRIMAAGLDTVSDRLRAVWVRSVYGLGVLLAYALGSIGAFLLFDWPPLLKQIVLSYLLVFLIIRLTLVLGRIFLSPGAERFRVVPMATATARFWFVWSAILVGYYFFVKATLDLLATLGVGRSAGYLVGVMCGILLLALTLFVVWRSPTWDGRERGSHEHRLGAWLLSLYLVIVWLLLFTGSATPFYVGIIVLLLPIAIRVNHRSVAQLLRPAGSETGADAVPSFSTVLLERSLRAVLLIGGAFLIAWILDLDLGTLTARDTLETRLLRGVLHAVVILLLADFAWHILKAIIDRKLAGEQQVAGDPSTEQARRQARLRTLLPILRNVLLVVLVVMALLMTLSAFGVEVGPLIAGAGVVGVAIGFGAQTLVKDIISGIFFLLDDAFRVGEYIQTGNYKGTVESFSLRSVKLRHHRGPLYTVPFGILGAIQNMSRDWVIDKLTVGVTYDTELDKVKKLIRQIGKELTEDPELAPHIIETLKMQGVEQFGDFAIQVRMKMMTKPGEQFVVRRRAHALIKKAFDANGIKFAYPTVQVAGGEQAEAAAGAQQGLQLIKPRPSAT
jgi:small-conductance mechanosensitive channel